MRHQRFMVLTGHLDDYSLPGLIKILHGQRKSGRLQVEYTESPAAFYFEEGRLVDAKLGDLRGIEALYLALSLKGASFNFNPLIKPPERTVEEREQKLIQGLLEAPPGGDAPDTAITVGSGAALSPTTQTASTPAALQAANSQTALAAPVEERLVSEVGAMLAAHSRRFSRERAIYAIVIAALLLGTFISRLRNEATTPNVAPQQPTQSETAAPPAANAESARPAEMPKERASIAGQSQAGKPEVEQNRVREQMPDASETTNSAKGKERSSKQSKTANAATSKKDELKAGSKAEREASRAAQNGSVVQVQLRVERGRVLQAVVQNSRRGMESYEALALRIARQRQYPKDFTGRDVLKLKVKP